MTRLYLSATLACIGSMLTAWRLIPESLRSPGYRWLAAWYAVAPVFVWLAPVIAWPVARDEWLIVRTSEIAARDGARRVTQLLAVLCVVVLTACTSASRDATLAASHLVALQDQYQHAAAIYERHIDTVPEPRRAEVQRAWAVVELLYDRLQTGDLPAIAEALALYEIARPAWRELRAEAVALIDSGQIA